MEIIEEKMKNTVGVTSTGAHNLEELMESGWFDSETTAYLLSVSTALAKNLPISLVPLVGKTTKFNVGTLDRNGRLRNLILLLGPNNVKDPYEFSERLADVGLDHLKTRVVDQGLRLSEVIVPKQEDEEEE